MCEIIFTINFYFENFQTTKSHCRLSQKCHSNFETIKNIMRIKRINHREDATLFNALLLRSVASYVENNIINYIRLYNYCINGSQNTRNPIHITRRIYYQISRFPTFKGILKQ